MLEGDETLGNDEMLEGDETLGNDEMLRDDEMLTISALPRATNALLACSGRTPPMFKASNRAKLTRIPESPNTQSAGSHFAEIIFQSPPSSRQPVSTR